MKVAFKQVSYNSSRCLKIFELVAASRVIFYFERNMLPTEVSHLLTILPKYYPNFTH